MKNGENKRRFEGGVSFSLYEVCIFGWVDGGESRFRTSLLLRAYFLPISEIQTVEIVKPVSEKAGQLPSRNPFSITRGLNSVFCQHINAYYKLYTVDKFVCVTRHSCCVYNFEIVSSLFQSIAKKMKNTKRTIK